MPCFVPVNADTLEEQRLYTQARLAEIACLDCLATVAVKKNSDHHTSIQWSAEAVAACSVLGRRGGASGERDGHRGCPRLLASIDAAVQDGQVPVGAEDGY